MIAQSRLSAWRDFHRDNRNVFERFVHFARQARKAGLKKCGARRIGEIIRWDVEVVTRSADEFKVNDHHWPYYARLLMLLYPGEFSDFFETRDAHFEGTDNELLDAHRRPAGAPFSSLGMLF